MSFVPTLEEEDEEDDMFIIGVDDDDDDEETDNFQFESKAGDEFDDESDDSETEAAFGAFQANKALNMSSGSSKPTTIRRNYSYTSFLTRSQRAHEHPDLPPPPEEVAKHKVQFTEEHAEYHIEVEPPLSKHEKKLCFLTEDDWDRIQLDVDMTLRRWEYHKAGKLKFDESNNTLRGLEAVQRKSRPMTVYKHTQDVLKEIHRQKVDQNGDIDWEKIRQVATESSLEDNERAKAVAEKDAFAATEAWKEPSSPEEEGKKKKKKLGSSLKFWSSKKKDKSKRKNSM